MFPDDREAETWNRSNHWLRTTLTLGRPWLPRTTLQNWSGINVQRDAPRSASEWHTPPVFSSSSAQIWSHVRIPKMDLGCWSGTEPTEVAGTQALALREQNCSLTAFVPFLCHDDSCQTVPWKMGHPYELTGREINKANWRALTLPFTSKNSATSI